jgi:hypothetical protein
MNYRKNCALLGFLLLCLLQASAQGDIPPLNKPNYSKARIFDDLPERMPLRITEFEKLLDLPVGTKVNASVNKEFSIIGNIVSKSNGADPNVKSVVIKAINRQGSIFTFTRIADANGVVSYSGRMLNRAGGDALEIAKEGNGYIIRKKGIYDLMNE